MRLWRVGGSRSGDLDRDPRDGGNLGSPRLTRRKFLARLSGATAGTMALTVVGPVGTLLAGWERPLPPSAFGSEVATEWFDLALELVQRTPGIQRTRRVQGLRIRRGDAL
jgi:hypothetical protein